LTIADHVLSCLRESRLEPAACERAADRRGSRVLIRSRTLSNPLPDGGGFFVLTSPLDGNN
jgi:hypothetical protein